MILTRRYFEPARVSDASGPDGLSAQFIRLMAKAGIESPKGAIKTGRAASSGSSLFTVCATRSAARFS